MISKACSDAGLIGFYSKKKAINWIKTKKHPEKWQVRFCPACNRWHAYKLEPPPEKQCSKIKHNSMRTARQHAKQLNSLGEWWVIPYQCSRCRKYHVGHAPQNIREKILQKSMKYMPEWDDLDD